MYDKQLVENRNDHFLPPNRWSGCLIREEKQIVRHLQYLIFSNYSRNTGFFVPNWTFLYPNDLDAHSSSTPFSKFVSIPRKNFWIIALETLPFLKRPNFSFHKKTVTLLYKVGFDSIHESLSVRFEDSIRLEFQHSQGPKSKMRWDHRYRIF